MIQPCNRKRRGEREELERRINYQDKRMKHEE
jgi:hypothetical protein